MPRLNRIRARRLARFAKKRIVIQAGKTRAGKSRQPKVAAANLPPRGFDPELLYVECGRCGAPVLWDEGRATELLNQAGIDPLELDSSCMLVTDGCPSCGMGGEYGVRIFRITEHSSLPLPPSYGHA